MFSLSSFDLSSFYRHGVIRSLVETFYLCGDDSNRQNRFNQSNISNYGHYRYSSHYFIKFIGFIMIYYAINLDIVSSCMVFSYFYLRSFDILQV